MSTKAEFETELAVIKARADYYERPDLISRRTFLETELNRLNGVALPGNVFPSMISLRNTVFYSLLPIFNLNGMYVCMLYVRISSRIKIIIVIIIIIFIFF